jgi:hypothetical protein
MTVIAALLKAVDEIIDIRTQRSAIHATPGARKCKKSWLAHLRFSLPE